MGKNWIIDVLADIRTFALQNDLPELADHLNETMLVARTEIESSSEGTPFAVGSDVFATRRVFGEFGTGRRA